MVNDVPVPIPVQGLAIPSLTIVLCYTMDLDEARTLAVPGTMVGSDDGDTVGDKVEE